MILKNLFTILFLLITVVGVDAAKLAGINPLGYTIQMGAFANVDNAERFVSKLQAKGLDAFYFRKDSGVYAVRFGDFPSKQKARDVAKKLVSERLITSYYVAPPNEVVFAKAKASGVQQKSSIGAKKPSLRLQPVVPEELNDKLPLDKSKKANDMGSVVARTAERFVGIPYRWGGDTVVDGMDCSGFVRAVYNLCGLSIPRTSKEQYKVGDLVSKSDLQEGDLLFFGTSVDKINHVGIYVGGDTFVHAPRRGEDIRTSSINESYFEKRFVGAKRYF